MSRACRRTSAHSFAPDTEGEATLATTEHGVTFASIVGQEGILGLQFHPEKSSHMGARLLAGFVRGIA